MRGKPLILLINDHIVTKSDEINGLRMLKISIKISLIVFCFNVTSPGNFEGTKQASSSRFYGPNEPSALAADVSGVNGRDNVH